MMSAASQGMMMVILNNNKKQKTKHKTTKQQNNKTTKIYFEWKMTRIGWRWNVIARGETVHALHLLDYR
jgi:hypothetical protein